MRDDLRRLQDRSVQVRLEVLKLVDVAGSGHYGPAFSCADILVSLYYDYLNLRPREPQWQGRDRFILSKGHACSALYPILADLGFFDSSMLDTFTRLGSRFGDHPDMRKVPGVDFSSGSLGHGLSIGCGMAEALRFQGLDSRVVVLLGDGELNEGQVWEAVAYARHARLSNLLAIVDANGVSVDGSTEDVLDFQPLDQKWEAFGWQVETVDGHDLAALRRSYAHFDESRKEAEAAPTVLIARTVVGRGVSFIEGLAEWHVGYLHGEDRVRAERDICQMFDRVIPRA